MADLNLMQTRIGDYYCTNLPVSEAISLVAARVPIPVNVVIDLVDEPSVTVSKTNATLGAVIDELLSHLPNYSATSVVGSLLISPKYLAKDSAFPLNKVLQRFDVTYSELETPRGKTYRCEFDWERAASLNVAMPPLFLKARPNFQNLPAVHSYKSQSLLNILIDVSKNIEKSWCCCRLRPSYVRQQNQEWAQRQLGPTWWPNEDAPCYSLLWGRGAFHGVSEEAHATTIKHDEAAAVRWTRQRLLNQAMANGVKNRGNSPVMFQAGIDVERSNGTHNIWLSLQITNRTAEAVQLANPFLGDMKSAFWRVVRVVQDPEKLGGYGAYDISLPLSETGEPPEISLAPYGAFERKVNLLGTAMVLDELTMDNSFSGAKVEKLGSPDTYSVAISLFFKDQHGTEYYLGPTGLEFVIKPDP